ncbi:ComEA family DNA-binding protein [Dokdonella sp.]|uniref:ComEA family DNA-binding protein n=1 Tax=Dokdonella sp. TaxID=2291710 RepID=UPI0031CB03CA|nr:helix-hairpin-helix domain-containing protein [Dokdonella sp.]
MKLALAACIRRLPALLLMLAFSLPAQAFAQVDINTADARTLAASLAGIGLVKAEAIVAYRDSNGPFTQVEDLLKVKGIGNKTLDANRDAIVILGPSQPPRRDDPRPTLRPF